MARPDWVAEEPEAHLLPHLERWCARPGAPLRILSATTAPDGCFEVALEWEGRDRDLMGVCAACFGLLGAVAESGTYVRQRVPAEASGADGGGAAPVAEFEVATGMLDPDTPFSSHGHTLRLRVCGVPG